MDQRKPPVPSRVSAPDEWGKTTTPTRRERGKRGNSIQHKTSLFLVVAVVAVVGGWLVLRNDAEGHVRTPDAFQGVPTADTPTVPVPVATERPLTLALDLPALNDSQRYWLHVVQVSPRCPLCVGLDKPPVTFTDNESTVFAALVLSECSLNPFDEWGNFKVNEIGARGCAQLTGALITPENMWDPVINIYDGAREFRRLIDGNGGDIMQAVRDYKGVQSSDMEYQSNSIFSVIRIGG